MEPKSSTAKDGVFSVEKESASFDNGSAKAKYSRQYQTSPFRRVLDLGGAVLALILLCGILFAGEPIGLSDNGDFVRIMKPNGISYLKERQAKGVFETEYAYSGFLYPIQEWGRYPTLQHPVTRLSVGINRVLDKLIFRDGIYRIECLAFIHIICMVFAIWILFTGLPDLSRWKAILLRAVILVVLCDIGYIIWFQSFYGEALQVIFLTFCAGFLMRWMHKGKAVFNLVFFLLSLIGFAISKPANLPISIGGTLLLLTLLVLHPTFQSKKKAILMGVFTTVLLSTCLFFIPHDITWDTRHNAFFFGVLREHPNPEAVLKELSLPESLVQYSDTHAYVKGIKKKAMSDPDYAIFDKSVSRIDIVLYYLKHPDLMLDKMKISASNAGMIRPAYLANRTSEHGRMAFSHKFELWGSLRRILPFNTLHGILLAWVFVILVFVKRVYNSFVLKKVVKKLSNNTNDIEKSWTTWLIPRIFVLLFAGFSYIYAFMLPYISNGQADIAKHLFLAGHILDFMLLFSLGSLIALPASRKVYPLSKQYSFIKCDGIQFDRIAEKEVARQFRNKTFLIVIIIIALIFVLLSPIQAFMVESKMFNRDKTISKGEFIQLGAMNKEVAEAGVDYPLKWRVLRVQNEKADILAVKPVAQRRFSDLASGLYGSNLWKSSELRSWLNSSFMDCFTPNEKAIMISTEHRVLLPEFCANKADEGTREVYWIHVASLCAGGWKDAYAARSTDMIRLPNLSEIQAMARSCVPLTKALPYWLIDPYYYNDSMVRYAGRDGYIYMKDAAETLGVVPVITVDINKTDWNGDGTEKSPWRSVE